MRLNKSKCKILNLGHNNLCYHYKLGDVSMELKRTWAYWWMANWT